MHTSFKRNIFKEKLGNCYFPWLKVICNFLIEDKKGNELKFDFSFVDYSLSKD